MREVRLLARILRHGLLHLPLPGVPPSTPPGWSAYRAVRRSGAHRQTEERLLLMGGYFSGRRNGGRRRGWLEARPRPLHPKGVDPARLMETTRPNFGGLRCRATQMP